MDMSLDEVISSNKSAFRTKRGRGGLGRGRGSPRRGRGTMRGGRGAKFSRGGSIRGRDNLRRVRGGGITKRRSGGFPFSPKQNDQPVKLNISNLDFGVSDSDISELFSEFGTMKNAVLHYDRTGRSIGTAHVIFERRGDAMKAIKQYHDVHLDGRPMKITIDEPKRALTQNSPRLSGGRTNLSRGGNRSSSAVNGTSRGARRGGRGRGGFSRGGRRGRGRGGRQAISAEQLDAELDAYAGQANK